MASLSDAEFIILGGNLTLDSNSSAVTRHCTTNEYANGISNPRTIVRHGARGHRSFISRGNQAVKVAEGHIVIFVGLTLLEFKENAGQVKLIKKVSVAS